MHRTRLRYPRTRSLPGSRLLQRHRRPPAHGPPHPLGAAPSTMKTLSRPCRRHGRAPTGPSRSEGLSLRLSEGGPCPPARRRRGDPPSRGGRRRRAAARWAGLLGPRLWVDADAGVGGCPPRAAGSWPFGPRLPRPPLADVRPNRPGPRLPSSRRPTRRSVLPRPSSPSFVNQGIGLLGGSKGKGLARDHLPRPSYPLCLTSLLSPGPTFGSSALAGFGSGGGRRTLENGRSGRTRGPRKRRPRRSGRRPDCRAGRSLTGRRYPTSGPAKKKEAPPCPPPPPAPPWFRVG